MLHKYADYIQVVMVNATGGFMAWMFKLETLQKGVFLTLLIYNLIKIVKALDGASTETKAAKKMINKKNIKGSPITSIAGIVLIVLSAWAVLFKGVSYDIATVILGIGVALLFGKDPKIGGSAGVILIVATVLLASCNRKITPVSSFHDRKDSTNVTTSINYRDTTIYSPVDSAKIKAMVKCPESGMLQLAPQSHRSHNATITVGIIDNKLTAECLCDSIELRLKLRDKQVSIYRNAMESLKETNVVMVKFVPKWIKAFAWIGAGFISMLLLYLIWRLIKAYLKPF